MSNSGQGFGKFLTLCIGNEGTMLKGYWQNPAVESFKIKLQ